jgi:hypothetical protein
MATAWEDGRFAHGKQALCGVTAAEGRSLVKSLPAGYPC